MNLAPVRGDGAQGEGTVVPGEHPRSGDCQEQHGHWARYSDDRDRNHSGRARGHKGEAARPAGAADAILTA
jgi:hypothetical protein